MHGGMVSNRLERDMAPWDAVITLQCLPPDLVRVIETIEGQSTRDLKVHRYPDVVTELEERYIFFANQAETARRRLKLGRSCVFSVYFREP
jgi:hypothetical protein